MIDERLLYESVARDGVSFAEADAAFQYEPGVGSSPLEQWYLKIRSRPLSTLDDADLARAARQGVHLPLTLPRCIERLEAERLAGALYDGELLLASLRAASEIADAYPRWSDRIRTLAQDLLDHLDLYSPDEGLGRTVDDATLDAIRRELEAGHRDHGVGDAPNPRLVFDVGARRSEITLTKIRTISLGTAVDCSIRFDACESGWQEYHADVRWNGSSYVLHAYHPVRQDERSTIAPIALTEGVRLTIGCVNVSVEG